MYYYSRTDFNRQQRSEKKSSLARHVDTISTSHVQRVYHRSNLSFPFPSMFTLFFKSILIIKYLRLGYIWGNEEPSPEIFKIEHSFSYWESAWVILSSIYFVGERIARKITYSDKFKLVVACFVKIKPKRTFFVNNNRLFFFQFLNEMSCRTHREKSASLNLLFFSWRWAEVFPGNVKMFRIRHWLATI